MCKVRTDKASASHVGLGQQLDDMKERIEELKNLKDREALYHESCAGTWQILPCHSHTGSWALSSSPNVPF